MQYLRKRKDLFDAKLQAISNALKISIKKMRNGSFTIISVFIDLYAPITEILN